MMGWVVLGLLGLGVWGMVDAHDRESTTVYEIHSCTKKDGCRGFTYGRWVPDPMVYTAFPDRQDVMMQWGPIIMSLTHDAHYRCRVMTSKNWACTSG